MCACACVRVRTCFRACMRDKLLSQVCSGRSYEYLAGVTVEVPSLGHSALSLFLFVSAVVKRSI